MVAQKIPFPLPRISLSSVAPPRWVFFRLEAYPLESSMGECLAQVQEGGLEGGAVTSAKGLGSIVLPVL